MSGAATVTARTPSISIAADSGAMILSRMATYDRAETSSGVVVDKDDNDDNDDGDGGSGVDSRGEKTSDEFGEKKDVSIEKHISGTSSTSTLDNPNTGSHHRQHHQQQPARASKSSKNESRIGPQSRQNLINQASAIRRTNPGGGHSGRTTSATSGSMNNDQADQFQHHEEFNKMRERLFRLLSKVPIQVESSRETNCCAGGDSTVLGNQDTGKREPLIIKYYNERYLAEILDLHFGCSLLGRLNHSDDGRHQNQSLNNTPPPPYKGARSDFGYPAHHEQQLTGCLPSNQLALAQHCLDGTTATTPNLPDNQQQAFDYHHHQPAYPVEWQHPATGSRFSSFQWQPYEGNLMEAKPGLCPSDPTSSTASASSRRLGGSSSSNSSSSSHRGSSAAATASIVMKDIITHQHQQQHPVANKKSSCSGSANVVAVAVKSARQRRQAKHHGHSVTSRVAAGGGLRGSSPPPTTNSSRTDITSPLVGGINNNPYPGQAQDHSNRKQTAIKYCHLMESAPSEHLTQPPGGQCTTTFANQQLAFVGGAFSSQSADHGHNYNNLHQHHLLQQQSQQQQTQDPNQNIHLHLYAQHRSPYHHSQHPQQQQQQHSIMEPQVSSGEIALTTMDGSSSSQAHFNLQPAGMEQQHLNHQEPTTSIIPFRQAHYHHPTLQSTTVAHDDGHGADEAQQHQQLTVYDHHQINIIGGGIPLEQAQLLQHQQQGQQQQHQNNPMTTAIHLAHEQLPVSVGVQYYTTMGSHSAQLSSVVAGTGNSYHHHPEQPCSDSANNNWRSQLFQIDEQHQQMIEQQQQPRSILSDNYGTREDRSFRSANCASTYSLLYANGVPRQQSGVIELQLDMTLNGSQ